MGENAFLYQFSCSRELGGGTWCLCSLCACENILVGCTGCGI